ncbi:MAG TPA: ATP-binding protein [Planctomycetaceae bacterium]|nr:ATP-binding protein [Planctomycetaceae bacterium]
MALTLRQRIFSTLAPLLLLLAVLGGAGVILLSRLGDSAKKILRENYDSIIAMERLNEALERIDSSFQFALSKSDEIHNKARRQYEQNWPAYLDALNTEKNNITIQGEAELVAELAALTDAYREKGDEFHARPTGDPQQHEKYFGSGGLLESFIQIKRVSGEILRLNQSNMEASGKEAQRIARHSLAWFAGGMAVAIVFACILAWHTVASILRPIQAMTSAAKQISADNPNQVVPYVGRDELGQLAQAFNTMAHHLRDYRESQSARLLRAQQTIQATIDSFPDPVLVIDFEGYVETANPAARRLLGVVPKQKDQAVAAIWHPPEPLRQPLSEALKGERDFLPEGFERAILFGSNGHERVMLPRILTIRDPYGSALGAAVLLQDVTRLRLLDQVKSNLVATAGHELKTPLTSVRLALHLLLEENLGPLTPKQVELLLDARENSERLLTVVNNLLDLARLEQGARQLETRPESPASLLQATADAIRPQAEDKGIEILVSVSPGLPAVAVDASRLGLALRNLLDNALEYTDRGGRITLAAGADAEGVVLSVADTGIGIPGEQLVHVFDKFFRVPGQSRGAGTGLGLAIVHEIVAAHGGAVSCESRPGAGTVFRLRLPKAAERAAGDSTFVGSVAAEPPISR